MNKLVRGLIAAYGAKKLGGGCFSTILVFIVIYYALGQCNHPAATAPQRGSIQHVQPAKTAMLQPNSKTHALAVK